MTGLDRRAVSDVVGYVLVFALLTATIGSVFAFGLVGLDDRQEVEQVNNVERAFDVLADNLRDVYRTEAPSRATEIKLGGGALSYGDRTEIVVERGGENVTIRSDPIVYRMGDRQVVYESGAVFRTDRGSSGMIRDPPFVFAEDRTMLFLVENRWTGGSSSVAGDRTLLIRGRTLPDDRDGTSPATFDDGSEDVTITVNSTRADGWARYFERVDDRHDLDGTVDADPENDTVTYAFETETVDAPQALVRVRFIR